MTIREQAEQLFPCNCNPTQSRIGRRLEPGEHWSNCQVQYKPRVEAALCECERATWEAALKKVRADLGYPGISTTQMFKEMEALAAKAKEVGDG